MSHHPARIARTSRLTRGGTVARVLLIIVGVSLALFGGLLTIGGIALLFDGDSAGIFILIFSLLILLGGVALVVGQATAGRREATGAERVVSSVPLGDVVPVPAPAPEPATRGDAPHETPGDANPTEEVAHLVFRSTDLFATLRDLVRHGAAAGSDKRHLAGLLEAAGIMDWPDAPACEGGRLTRNTHYWIRLNPDGLTDEQYDTLITTEAALGINQDLPALRTEELASERATEGRLELMRKMVDQAIEEHPLADEGMRVCYHDADPATTPGEWIVRSVVCNAAECVRTPFRVVFDLRCNMADGLAVLSLEVPRPRCMALFAQDDEGRMGLARAYALRLSTLLALHAFQASDKLTRVVVNCHEHEREETLLSLDLTPALAERLRDVCQTTLVEEAFPTDAAVRASFEGSQWFVPVEPFVSLDDPQATPAPARVFPELDPRPVSAAIAATCHAKRICDLGINENAARISAWHELRPQLGDSVSQAVSALVAARNDAHDITVAEACTRTIQALVDGDVDLDDLGAVASLFIDGSALDRAVVRANELLDDEQGTPDPEAAVKILEAALAPIDDMGAYLDDATCVYRYFGSVSERIHHNAAINEGGREIRLVPDSYFNAHCNASIAHGMLEHYDEALAHADICMRLAPTSTYATMRKVRVLEAQSRIFEAADLITEALRHAKTPRDAAICHYRLAYMEWKLGRENLAAACYQRSLTWDTEMSAQAREELDDLLSATPGLERPTEEQADALLAREGIPLGCIRSDGERTLAAAVACMDDGAFLSARPLMASLFAMNNDDVVMGVYRSLNVSV